MRVCVHRDECMRTYMSACVYTDVKKKEPNFVLLVGHGIGWKTRCFDWSSRCDVSKFPLPVKGSKLA